MTTKITHIKTILAVIVAILTWSSAYVFIRIGLQGYTPGALALLRYLISSLIMLVLYSHLPKRQRPTFKEASYIFTLGFVGIGIYTLAIHYGEITVSAGIASFLVGLSPIVALIWVRLFMKESISRRRWLGISLSVMGLFVIMISKHKENSLDWHIIVALIATVCGGVYSVAQKPLMKKFHPIEVATLCTCSATVAFLIFTPALLTELPKASLHATGAAIYLAIASGCIGYGCWSYAMSSDISPSKLIPSGYALPLVTTLLGWLILHEIPSPFALTGGCIALIGAIIATK